MNISSESEIPIFISSTASDLHDLREELADFLQRAGYKPLLSSGSGFPEYVPELTPWESCLRVLRSSFIVILVVNGKYGEKKEWKKIQPTDPARSVAPTHGEYLYAQKLKKKILVFVRNKLDAYHEIYRGVLQEEGGDKSRAYDRLKSTMPKHIEIETLEFIEEIKTTFWINTFDSVVDLKKEFSKRINNILADTFKSHPAGKDSIQIDI